MKQMISSEVCHSSCIEDVYEGDFVHVDDNNVIHKCKLSDDPHGHVEKRGKSGDTIRWIKYIYITVKQGVS